jgi:hypothetical protein
MEHEMTPSPRATDLKGDTMITPHPVRAALPWSALIPFLFGPALAALLFVAAVILALAPGVNHFVPSHPAALQNVRLLSGSGQRQSLPLGPGTAVLPTTTATAPPVSPPSVSSSGGHGHEFEQAVAPMAPVVTTTTAVPADPPVVLTAHVCIVTVTGTWGVASFTEDCTGAQDYVAPPGTTATVISASEQVTTDAGSLAGS